MIYPGSPGRPLKLSNKYVYVYAYTKLIEFRLSLLMLYVYKKIAWFIENV